MKGIFLNPERVINGSFGELLDENGIWLANCQGISFSVNNERKSWKAIGSRRTAYKLTGTFGEGTIDFLKVNSENMVRIAATMWDQSIALPQGVLVVFLDDPESSGIETIVLQGVKMWIVNGGWKVNEFIQESVQFTFHTLNMPSQVPLTYNNLFDDDWGLRYGSQRNF